ncbi:hypothetical protein ACH50O_03500 [Methylomonas sp. 2BW1-5-20]|uniref:hypothetical protein n=1 Tax=Methylomonas sp. 2BW1-5-20 TaxID=3376686 RepID=UPI00404BDA3E
MTNEHRQNSPKKKLESLFDDLLRHDGFGDMRVEMRLLKRGQKEVIIYCGKQYRYVVDFEDKRPAAENPQANREGFGGPP